MAATKNDPSSAVMRVRTWSSPTTDGVTAIVPHPRNSGHTGIRVCTATAPRGRISRRSKLVEVRAAPNAAATEDFATAPSRTLPVFSRR